MLEGIKRNVEKCKFIRSAKQNSKNIYAVAFGGLRDEPEWSTKKLNELFRWTLCKENYHNRFPQNFFVLVLYLVFTIYMCFKWFNNCIRQIYGLTQHVSSPTRPAPYINVSSSLLLQSWYHSGPLTSPAASLITTPYYSRLIFPQSSRRNPPENLSVFQGRLCRFKGNLIHSFLCETSNEQT